MIFQNFMQYQIFSFDGNRLNDYLEITELNQIVFSNSICKFRSC